MSNAKATREKAKAMQEDSKARAEARKRMTGVKMTAVKK